MKSFKFILKIANLSFFLKIKPIKFHRCSYQKEMMNTTVQSGNGIAYDCPKGDLFMSGIDPIDNDPFTDNGSHTYAPPKVPDLDDIALGLYYPENTKGPDPSEEEQRDRSNKEKINMEEDLHKEKPDHSEEDIYDAESDQKEKDKKNALS